MAESPTPLEKDSSFAKALVDLSSDYKADASQHAKQLGIVAGVEAANVGLIGIVAALPNHEALRLSLLMQAFIQPTILIAAGSFLKDIGTDVIAMLQLKTATKSLERGSEKVPYFGLLLRNQAGEKEGVAREKKMQGVKEFLDNTGSIIEIQSEIEHLANSDESMPVKMKQIAKLRSERAKLLVVADSVGLLDTLREEESREGILYIASELGVKSEKDETKSAWFDKNGVVSQDLVDREDKRFSDIHLEEFKGSFKDIAEEYIHTKVVEWRAAMDPTEKSQLAAKALAFDLVDEQLPEVAKGLVNLKEKGVSVSLTF